MLTCLLALTTLAADYHFTTPDHEITMKVKMEKPYRGQPLAFYQGDQRHCYGGKCIERFHGAVATVHFTFAPTRAKAPEPTALREVVTVIEQSADLPPADTLDLTLPVQNRHASDLQVLGYDEDGVPAAERARMRAEAPARMYRTVRQELSLNGVPFAVIVWKHTMQGIEIVRANKLRY